MKKPIYTRPPVYITQAACEKIRTLKIANKTPNYRRLRIQSIINPDLDMLDFNMFFDDTMDKNDGLYISNEVEFVLDTETAYNLVGSDLRIDSNGEFEFRHFDNLILKKEVFSKENLNWAKELYMIGKIERKTNMNQQNVPEIEIVTSRPFVGPFLY